MALYHNCSDANNSLYNDMCLDDELFMQELEPPDNDAKFSNQDNIDQRFAMLNQELVLLGLPSVYGKDSEDVDLFRLVNSCFDLLLLYHKTVKQKEELDCRYHRCLTDLDQSRTALSRLKAELDRSQRSCAKYQEKERQEITKNKTLTAKLKSERAEVKRLMSVIARRDVQYKHDLKKREGETDQLKERLQKLLMDKKHVKFPDMNVINVIKRADGCRGTWKTRTGPKKGEEEMRRSMIANYTERQEILRTENAKLRDILQEMHTEIGLVFELGESSLKDSPESATLYSDEDSSLTPSKRSYLTEHKLHEGIYKMPYGMVEKDIERRFHQASQMLKELIRKSRQNNLSEAAHKKTENVSNGEAKFSSTPVNNGMPENVDDLEEKLVQYKLMVKEQENLIQDTQLRLDKESLGEVRRRLTQANRRIEDEGKQLTDASVRLSRQRKDVDDEKAPVLEERFLQSSSLVSDVRLLTPRGSTEESRHLQVLTNNASSQSVLMTRSSATELYTTMGLSTASPQKKWNLKGKRPLTPQITKAPDWSTL